MGRTWGEGVGWFAVIGWGEMDRKMEGEGSVGRVLRDG